MYGGEGVGRMGAKMKSELGPGKEEVRQQGSRCRTPPLRGSRLPGGGPTQAVLWLQELFHPNGAGTVPSREEPLGFKG